MMKVYITRDGMYMFFSVCERLKGEQMEGSNILIPTQANFGQDFCEYLNAWVVWLTADFFKNIINKIT